MLASGFVVWVWFQSLFFVVVMLVSDWVACLVCHTVVRGSLDCKLEKEDRHILPLDSECIASFCDFLLACP